MLRMKPKEAGCQCHCARRIFTSTSIKWQYKQQLYHEHLSSFNSPHSGWKSWSSKCCNLFLDQLEPKAEISVEPFSKEDQDLDLSPGTGDEIQLSHYHPEDIAQPRHGCQRWQWSSQSSSGAMKSQSRGNALGCPRHFACWLSVVQREKKNIWWWECCEKAGAVGEWCSERFAGEPCMKMLLQFFF